MGGSAIVRVFTGRKISWVQKGWRKEMMCGLEKRRCVQGQIGLYEMSGTSTTPVGGPSVVENVHNDKL